MRRYFWRYILCLSFYYFDKFDETFGASYLPFLTTRMSFYCFIFINASGRGLKAISSYYYSASEINYYSAFIFELFDFLPFFSCVYYSSSAYYSTSSNYYFFFLFCYYGPVYVLQYFILLIFKFLFYWLKF